MDNANNGYHISFFKPTTKQATANRNMIIWMVSVWFVAIFGFQILLKVCEKPTPEPAYIAYQIAWGKIENGTQTANDFQELGKASLSVLGKMIAAPDEKIALNNALNWSLYQLTADSLKSNLISKVKGFEEIQAGIENIADPVYLEAKRKLTDELVPVLALSSADARSGILPIELESENMGSLTENTKSNLPVIMAKYLVHNQSFLTDTKFLGFPFHYFYTAVFLLILFVGLCLIYCIRIDKLNAKLNIVD